MSDERKKLIPLSEAARLVGCTPAYLNMLARSGKLMAQKVGRNWVTSAAWVNDHFGKDTIPDTGAEPDLELRKLEMQERIELRSVGLDIGADIDFGFIAHR